MRKIITIKRGEVSTLAKSFSVTTRCVRYALNFQSNTELAYKIRSRAIFRGAVYVNTEKKVQP